MAARTAGAGRRTGAALAAAVGGAVLAVSAAAAHPCGAPAPVAGRAPESPAPLLIEPRFAVPGAAVTPRLCLPPVGAGPPELSRVAAARDTLFAIDGLGPWFADLVEGEGITLCLDTDGMSGRGWFEPETRMLSVYSGMSTEDAVLILAHELRHVDQWRRGFRLSPDVTVAEHVRQTYALEADAAAFAAYVAWSSRAGGDDSLWAAAEALDRYGDVAVALGAAMDGGATPADGLLAAFRAWYASPWRTDGYWRSACGNYLDHLDLMKRPAGQAILPPGHFDALCVVPGVGSYGCATAPEVLLEPHAPVP
jgi:hypothetical protein